MSTMEQRLSTLESEVEAVKRQLAGMAKPRAWLDEVAGSMDDWPEFDQVLQLARESRLSLSDAPDGTREGG